MGPQRRRVQANAGGTDAPCVVLSPLLRPATAASSSQLLLSPRPHAAAHALGRRDPQLTTPPTAARPSCCQAPRLKRPSRPPAATFQLPPLPAAAHAIVASSRHLPTAAKSAEVAHSPFCCTKKASHLPNRLSWHSVIALLSCARPGPSVQCRSSLRLSVVAIVPTCNFSRSYSCAKQQRIPRGGFGALLHLSYMLFRTIWQMEGLFRAPRAITSDLAARLRGFEDQPLARTHHSRKVRRYLPPLSGTSPCARCRNPLPPS